MQAPQQVTQETVSMKIISKSFKLAGISSLALIVGVVTAVPSFAENSTTTNTTTTKETTGASASVCTRIITLQTKNEGNLSTHVGSMDSDFAKRLSGIAADQAAIDQKVATARTTASTEFDTKIAALKATAGLTAAQITAIETFQTTMKKDQTTRATAVDAARTAYRKALENDVQTHQSGLTSAVATYQAAITAAFSTAAASCGSGTGVIDTLRAAVKTARINLQTARSGDKVTSDIKNLIVTRNTAIKAANAAFVTAAQAATSTLSAALGSSASTSGDNSTKTTDSTSSTTPSVNSAPSSSN